MKEAFCRFACIFLCLSLVPFGPSYALPVIDSAGADVSVVEDVSAMTITAGNKAIINYSSFDIGSAETVQFVQPSSSAVALNRVTGSSASSINGSLLANGRIFLVNPNGVFIGANGAVNAAGFVASSLAISDSDFIAGNYAFSGGTGAGGVRNDGHINVSHGGIVGLIGRQVVNNGQIDCGYGAIILAAGDTVSVDFEGDGLMSFAVGGELADALVTNAGPIHGGGGNIVLAASAAADIANNVVNNAGLIEAKSVTGHEGNIRLVASGAGILNTGEITAAGRNGAAGGSVSLSGGAITNAGVINVSGDTGAEGGTVSLSAGEVVEGEIIADAVVEGEDAGADGEAAGSEVSAEAVGSVVNTGEIQAVNGQAVLEAAGDVINDGLINIADGVLDIDAGGEINNTGSINARGGAVEMDADGAISTSGSVIVGTLDEQGASFAVSGYFGVGNAYMDNADGAANFGTGTYNGTMSDAVNVVIDDGAVITLDGNLVITADSDANGTGYFNMGAGSSIVGAGFNLEIYSSEDSVLRDISGVGTLTVGESQAASAPTISMWGNVTVDDLVVNASTGDFTFAVGASLLTVNNSITNNDHISMWGGTIDLNGDFTRVGNLFAQRNTDTDDPAEIFIEGNWADTWWFGCDNSTVYFEGGVSTVDVGADAAANAFNNIVIQSSATLRPVNNDMQAANITLNDTSVSILDNSTNDLDLKVTGTLYIGSGCLYSTGTGINTIAALVNNSGQITCEGVGSSASNMVVTTMTNYNGSRWYYTNSTSAADLIPGTYYDLYINDGGAGRTFTMLDGDVAVNNDLTITNGTLQIASGNLDVGGDLTVAGALGIADGTLDVTGNVLVSGAFNCFSTAAISTGGNWSATGTFACGTSTVTFNGGGTSTVNAGGSNFRNITVSNGTTLQAVSNTLGATGMLTLTGAGSTLDMATNDRALNAAAMNVGTGTTYLTGIGAQTVGTLTNSGTVECEGTGFDGANLQFTTFTNNADSTMYFTKVLGSVEVGNSVTYSNLWFNGAAATYWLGNGTTTVTGNFRNMNGTVQVGNNTLNVAGNFNNNDTVLFQAGVLDVEGNIDDFGIITCNANTQIYVGGNVSDIYWFSPGTSTVTFDGGGTSTLSSGTTDAYDFYNLVIGSGTTLSLQTDAVTASFTNNGTLNLNGFTLYVAGSAYVPPVTGGGSTSSTTSSTSSSTPSSTTTAPTPAAATPTFPPSTTPAGGTDWSIFAGTGRSGLSSGGTQGTGTGAPVGAGDGSGDGWFFCNPGNGPVNSLNLFSPQSHFVVIDDLISMAGQSPFGDFGEENQD